MAVPDFEPDVAVTAPFRVSVAMAVAVNWTVVPVAVFSEPSKGELCVQLKAASVTMLPNASFALAVKVTF